MWQSQHLMKMEWKCHCCKSPMASCQWSSYSNPKCEGEGVSRMYPLHTSTITWNGLWSSSLERYRATHCLEGSSPYRLVRRQASISACEPIVPSSANEEGPGDTSHSTWMSTMRTAIFTTAHCFQSINAKRSSQQTCGECMTVTYN